jgi:hypothetical protein
MGLSIPQSFDASGRKFEPVPADNHVGILIGVTDLGTHVEQYPGQPAKRVKKVRLQWELPHVKRDDGSTATISAKYTFSFHEKSNFRKLLDQWLGANWHTQVKGGTLEFLLGTPAMVQVDHVPNKSQPGSTYAKVVNVAKVPRGMPVPEPTKDHFYLDLDTKTLPEKLSRWDAEMIRESDEYLAGGFTDNAPTPDQNSNGYSNGNGKAKHNDEHLPPVGVMPNPVADANDDLPF